MTHTILIKHFFIWCNCLKVTKLEQNLKFVESQNLRVEDETVQCPSW